MPDKRTFRYRIRCSYTPVNEGRSQVIRAESADQAAKLYRLQYKPQGSFTVSLVA